MLNYSGYFQFEYFDRPDLSEFYPEAVKLNTARNAIVYVILAKKYELIHIPFYICDSVIKALKNYNIKYKFYPLTEEFLPKIDAINSKESLLYPNYFGIHDNQARMVKEKHQNVIIDNTQAFFSKPIDKVDTVYSPRKFFGVSDGAYLFTDKLLETDLEQDLSYARIEPLMMRFELGAEFGYKAHKEVEESLEREPLKKMSKLTQEILTYVDYNLCMKKRRYNFYILNEILQEKNQFKFDNNFLNHSPMVYPFLNFKIDLRKELIAKKIFVPQWWRSVLTQVKKDSLEWSLSEYLIPLPIDHRYNEDDMRSLGSIVLAHL